MGTLLAAPLSCQHRIVPCLMLFAEVDPNATCTVCATHTKGTCFIVHTYVCTHDSDLGSSLNREVLCTEGILCTLHYVCARMLVELVQQGVFSQLSVGLGSSTLL